MCGFASTAWSAFARQVCRSVFAFMVQCWHLLTLNILLCFWDNYFHKQPPKLFLSCETWSYLDTIPCCAIQNLMEVSAVSELLRCNLWRRRHFINPHRLAGEIGGGRKPSLTQNNLFRFKKGGCCRCGKLGGIISL